MAGADYLKCAECSKRLLFDGEYIHRQRLEETNETVTCSHCVKKLKKKIEELKKHDRRKH